MGLRQQLKQLDALGANPLTANIGLMGLYDPSACRHTRIADLTQGLKQLDALGRHTRIADPTQDERSSPRGHGVLDAQHPHRACRAAVAVVAVVAIAAAGTRNAVPVVRSKAAIVVAVVASISHLNRRNSPIVAEKDLLAGPLRSHT